MKLIVLFFNLAFLAVCLGGLSGYEYQQPEEIALQQPHSYYPQPQQSYAPIEETYKKQFLIYSAPEEEFEDPHATHKISSSIQKNLRVLFIRAPEQKGLEQAALQLAKQVSDDKTAIYVLHRQTDVGDLANRLSVHREQYAHKPEVHFVKYRTPEDAARAQQQIQSQYDLLRGTSQTSNEGAAPVLDFATKQQQPIYGNAISVVPAYAGVGNAGNNLNGYYTQPVASSAGLGGISNYNTGVLGGGANLFSSFNTVGYNTNSVTTTSGGSYGAVGPVGPVGSVGPVVPVGPVGGIDAIGYNANAIDNAAVATPFSGYGDSRAANSQQILAANGASQFSNERVNTGGKLTFPTDGATENSYLPPLQRH